MNRFTCSICLQVYKNLLPFIHLYSINTITFLCSLLSSFTPLLYSFTIHILYIFPFLCFVIFFLCSFVICFIYILSLYCFYIFTINHRIFLPLQTPINTGLLNFFYFFCNLFWFAPVTLPNNNKRVEVLKVLFFFRYIYKRFIP